MACRSAKPPPYTLLSIGDGLVAQLPALLVSSAVAMLVTRASRSQDMAQAMTGQVFGQYRALAITAGIIGLVGLVPGMPNVAFLTLASILGFIAWKLYRKTQAPADAAATGKDPAASSRRPAAPAPTAELSWDELRPVDPLGLEVGYRLIPLVDSNQGGELMARIRACAASSPGCRLPDSIGTHPRQPGTARQRLPRAGCVAGGHADPPRPRARAGPGQRAARWKASPARTPRSASMPPGSNRTSVPRPKRWATRWSTRPPWSPPTFRT